jgi:hypothetical protein
MRLRRIAVGGMALGLLGVVVRAEGRAMGRVLLGVSDARVSQAAGTAAGRGRAGTAGRRAEDARKRAVSGPVAGVEI